MSYQGYGKFIVFRSNEDGYHKYDLVHSEITQFGHTVPYRVKQVSLKDVKKIDLDTYLQDKPVDPHEWLDEYVQNCMPYELDNFLDGYDFKLDIGEFAEICGFLAVSDTSGWTDCGYEYDSELALEEPVFAVFKLEDLKDSYYHNAWTIAEWTEYKYGLAEGESLEDLYNKLVTKGYSKTWQDIEDEEEAQREEYDKMMSPDKEDLETQKNIDLAGGGA